MHTIDVAYVGRGIHEELVAYVADQEGYFEDEGVHVAVRDEIRWKTERCSGGITIGLGQDLVVGLTRWRPHGKCWPSTPHRPLFWFLGRGEVKSMDDLRGRSTGGPRTPHRTRLFRARIVLRRHGLDPDRDLQFVVRAPGDYQMDLRGSSRRFDRCGLRGQHISGEQVADAEGFTVLSWVGDHFQIPTVGIAVDPTRLPLDNPATLESLVRANQASPSPRSPNNPSWPWKHRLVPRPAGA